MIKTIGTKRLYNLDNARAASEWVREEIKGIKTYDAPQLSSALKVKQSGRGKSVDNHIGYFTSLANNIYTNGTDVFIASECSSMANGFSIIPQNFGKVCALFTARKSVKSNWLNQKDEYMAPDESHPEYQQWVNDAIVYALFNSASNQSSLRGVEYKGQTYDIKNEWFWLSLAKVKQLADDNNQDDVYKDCRNQNERFVHEHLKGITLSPDAQAILDKATGILKATMKYRELFNDMKPEYNINSWDAGWYQIKGLAKEYAKAELDEFQKMYRAFEKRMREGVVKFGFLYDVD